MGVLARVASAIGLRKYAMQSVDDRGGWWPFVRESYSGAWQQNETVTVDTALAYHAIYACVTLISNDVGKLRQKLVQYLPSDGIWEETTSPAFSPVLRRPNRYQNHIQFKQWWLLSKLTRGNTYALKERDARGVVVALYLLDPTRVQVLVAPDGSVYYKLYQDNLSNLPQEITVPASEIIHDRMNCLFHPLVGVSPLYAAATAANIGIRISSNSSSFFGNQSRPGGLLVAPGSISQTTADNLKTYWQENYSGTNSGKVAVVGDGLKFEPMRMNAVDSQLIEQLKWTAEVACSAYHVPLFKIGLGQLPTYQNAELLNQVYYSDCLQSLIEEYEACMDEGLGLEKPIEGRQLGVELDLDGLLRMDTASQVKTLAEAVKGQLLTVDEGRQKLDRRKVEGGAVIWSQQQNWPLSELAKRDAEALNPKPAPEPAPPAEPDDDHEELPDEDVARMLAALLEKELSDARYS